MTLLISFFVCFGGMCVSIMELYVALTCVVTLRVYHFLDSMFLVSYLSDVFLASLSISHVDAC